MSNLEKETIQTTLMDLPWSEITSAQKGRTKSLNNQIPVRILKYLRKTFETLILGYSGGTDSTLLLLLCKEYNIRLDYILLNNTRMMLPTTNKYIRRVIEVLGYKDIFRVALPTQNRKELLEIITEDYQLNKQLPKHSKHNYRCCREAKEKPVREWLKTNELRKETTCVLRGLRADESSQRFMTRLQLIETGQFYFHFYKHAKPVKASDPLALMDEATKRVLLIKLCNKYNLALPTSSGCLYCPIVYKFIGKMDFSKDERREELIKFFQKLDGQKQLTDFLED